MIGFVGLALPVMVVGATTGVAKLGWASAACGVAGPFEIAELAGEDCPTLSSERLTKSAGFGSEPDESRAGRGGAVPVAWEWRFAALILRPGVASMVFMYTTLYCAVCLNDAMVP